MPAWTVNVLLLNLVTSHKNRWGPLAWVFCPIYNTFSSPQLCPPILEWDPGRTIGIMVLGISHS